MNNFTQDLYRYYGDDSYKFSVKLKCVLCTHGIQYTFIMRKVQNAKSILLKKFWKGALHVCKIITTIQIPPDTKIGPGLRILHFGNIVINPAVVIGKNFNIAQGCLIGGAEGKKKGFPTIGDNCCAFANSVIIGGIAIGNNVLISHGAFVNFDVPDNSIVIGNPGKIIPRDTSPTSKYILYNIDKMK